MIASQREWQTAIEPWRHGTRNDSFRVKISLNRKNPKLAPIVAPLSPLEELVQRSFHSPAAIQHRILERLGTRDVPTSPVKSHRGQVKSSFSPQVSIASSNSTSSSSISSPTNRNGNSNAVVDIVRRRRRVAKILRRVDEDEQTEKQKELKIDNDVVSDWKYLQRGQLLGHGSFGRGMFLFFLFVSCHSFFLHTHTSTQFTAH